MDHFKKCEGSAGMVECIKEKAGTIGYMDAGHGYDNDLAEIELKNRDGTLLTSKVAAERGGIIAAETGAFPDSPDQDFGGVSLVNRPGTNTWPIVQMSFIYVRKDISYIDDVVERALLIAFLRALEMEDYIGVCRDEYGFTLPSPEIQAYAQTGIDMLEASLENATEWVFEESTMSMRGAANLVFSSKRSDLGSVERDELEVMVMELQDQMAELLSGNGGSPSATSYSNEIPFNATRETQLVAALTMASISFICCAIYLFMAMTRFNKSTPPEGPRV
jgi:hypothetical protein